MFKALKEIFFDHIHNINQIFKLAKADLIKTYRGAALGWSWAIIKPCMTLFTYWFAFSYGFRSGQPVNGYPFFLWMAVGITPWFYMNEMLTMGTESIRKYRYLVTKMKFPVSIIPSFVSISKLAVNMILLAIVIVIFALMGYPPTIYYLQLPFYIIMSFIFWTLWAQLASMLAAISQDFANLVKSFITPIFWLSGILWRTETVKTEWIQTFLNLNPVSYITRGFRDSMIYNRWFFEAPKKLLYFVCWLLILWVLSLLSYKKLRKDIPDVL